LRNENDQNAIGDKKCSSFMDRAGYSCLENLRVILKQVVKGEEYTADLVR